MKLKGLVLGLALLFVWVARASAADTTLTWYGHAAFGITTPKGHVLVIDPWLRNPMNPAAKDKRDPVQDFKRVDYFLITHGHFDHTGDAAELAKATGARLVTNFELGSALAKLQGYPKNQMGFDTLMNIGGEITIADGEVMVAMVPAIHSSGMNNPFATEKEPDAVYGGNPAGFVIKIANGPTIYTTGDTAYFSDMKLIGQQYHPDVGLINIGGHFGMMPNMAARAAKAVGVKIAIPMHYATFPVLTQDPRPFGNEVKREGIRYVQMQPGETLHFQGNKLQTSKAH